MNSSSIRENLIQSIGNTPLIRLRRASEETGCTILGKAEFMNPGGSVKDRAAKAIVLDAEKQGVLKPGGLIVEGTAGNTGIGLALVGNSCGYRTLIVIPETQSQEKKDMLRLSGAELKEVPAVPYRDPQNYIKISGRLAEELNQNDPNGAIWANQFDNVANRQAHYQTTGPEIWEQTEGKVDAFICAVGTGGTLSGTGAFLKKKNPADIANVIIRFKEEDICDILSALTVEQSGEIILELPEDIRTCLLYTSPSPRDLSTSRMPSSA